MTTLPVVSHTLSAVAYDGSRHSLCVQFRDGACYQYTPVSHPLFAALLAADSKGSFFNPFLRSKFLFVQISPKPPYLSGIGILSRSGLLNPLVGNPHRADSRITNPARDEIQDLIPPSKRNTSRQLRH